MTDIQPEPIETAPSADAAPAADGAEVTVIPVSGGSTAEASGGYDVVVGRGLLARLPAMLGPHVRRVLVIHPRALRATGDVVKNDLEAAGLVSLTAEIPDAEEGKHLQVAGFCWQVLGQNDFTRSDAVSAVMEYLTSQEWARTRMALGGVATANQGVDPDLAPSDVGRRATRMLQSRQTTVEMDASDSMPVSVGSSALWVGLSRWSTGTVTPKEALKQAESAWPKRK